LAELPPVQEAVDAMVKSEEKENIQKMQGFMFWCSANCCEDSQVSMQQVHQCIERCHAPLAQALVTSELERFQDRLARCTFHCNDKAKDSMDAGNKMKGTSDEAEAGQLCDQVCG
jgi:hypothetical protein